MPKLFKMYDDEQTYSSLKEVCKIAAEVAAATGTPTPIYDSSDGANWRCIGTVEDTDADVEHLNEKVVDVLASLIRTSDSRPGGLPEYMVGFAAYNEAREKLGADTELATAIMDAVGRHWKNYRFGEDGLIEPLNAGRRGDKFDGTIAWAVYDRVVVEALWAVDRCEDETDYSPEWLTGWSARVGQPGQWFSDAPVMLRSRSYVLVKQYGGLDI